MSARALAVFAATALFACIDSSMDVFTLEDAFRSVCGSSLLIAQVVACLVLFLTACSGVTLRRQASVMYTPCAAVHSHAEEASASSLVSAVVGQEPITCADSVKSLELLSPSQLNNCPTYASGENELAELFETFDSSISSELQGQFRTIMDGLEAEQTQRLNEAIFNTHDLTQEAVRAFDASYCEDKQRVATQKTRVQSDFSIEEALDRLEQDVQRRSVEHVGRTSRLLDVNPLMVSMLVGLSWVGAQSAQIFTDTLLESAIVFVFMPLGYVVCSRLRLASSLSIR